MKENYHVHTATDGVAALKLLEHEQIDLMISDVMMPGMDGFELCQRVKTDINLSHIPVILLTTRTTDVSRIEGLQLGADDYITKPFNVEILRLRVKKFIDWEQNNHRQFRQKMNIEPSEITITPLDEQFIKKAIALVEKNIADSEFSVETMATEVGMSRTTLYKKLMTITGQGPAEFIRTIRIKRGRALLETSQMQVTEIAYAVGFTTDMIHWTSHGTVLSAADFPYAQPHGSWAGQVVQGADGKFYYYVTLDNKQNRQHTIDVAVSDSPTGPFLPARKDGTPLITDDMTLDSHRPNADIDPTVLIDDDDTPWMAWGNGDCYMVRLKKNMIELDGEVRKVPLRTYSEGPWLFKRGKRYYNVYASDAPGVQPEQMAYSYAESIQGPWTYGGFVSTSANHGFTIHPSVIKFKGKWYYIYHDGSYSQNGEPGGDCRRSVCAEYLHFNVDGTIRFVSLTQEGLSQHK